MRRTNHFLHHLKHNDRSQNSPTRSPSRFLCSSDSYLSSSFSSRSEEFPEPYKVASTAAFTQPSVSTSDPYSEPLSIFLTPEQCYLQRDSVEDLFVKRVENVILSPQQVYHLLLRVIPGEDADKLFAGWMQEREWSRSTSCFQGIDAKEVKLSSSLEEELQEEKNNTRIEKTKVPTLDPRFCKPMTEGPFAPIAINRVEGNCIEYSQEWMTPELGAPKRKMGRHDSGYHSWSRERKMDKSHPHEQVLFHSQAQKDHKITLDLESLRNEAETSHVEEESRVRTIKQKLYALCTTGPVLLPQPTADTTPFRSTRDSAHPPSPNHQLHPDGHWGWSTLALCGFCASHSKEEEELECVRKGLALKMKRYNVREVNIHQLRQNGAIGLARSISTTPGISSLLPLCVSPHSLSFHRPVTKPPIPIPLSEWPFQQHGHRNNPTARKLFFHREISGQNGGHDLIVMTSSIPSSSSLRPAPLNIRRETQTQTTDAQPQSQPEQPPQTQEPKPSSEQGEPESLLHALSRTHRGVAQPSQPPQSQEPESLLHALSRNYRPPTHMPPPTHRCAPETHLSSALHHTPSRPPREAQDFLPLIRRGSPVRMPEQPQNLLQTPTRTPTEFALNLSHTPIPDLPRAVSRDTSILKNSPTRGAERSPTHSSPKKVMFNEDEVDRYDVHINRNPSAASGTNYLERRRSQREKEGGNNEAFVVNTTTIRMVPREDEEEVDRPDTDNTEGEGEGSGGGNGGGYARGRGVDGEDMDTGDMNTGVTSTGVRGGPRGREHPFLSQGAEPTPPLDRMFDRISPASQSTLQHHSLMNHPTGSTNAPRPETGFAIPTTPTRSRPPTSTSSQYSTSRQHGDSPVTPARHSKHQSCEHPDGPRDLQETPTRPSPSQYRQYRVRGPYTPVTSGGGGICREDYLTANEGGDGNGNGNENRGSAWSRNDTPSKNTSHCLSGNLQRPARAPNSWTAIPESPVRRPVCERTHPTPPQTPHPQSHRTGTRSNSGSINRSGATQNLTGGQGAALELHPLSYTPTHSPSKKRERLSPQLNTRGSSYIRRLQLQQEREQEQEQGEKEAQQELDYRHQQQNQRQHDTIPPASPSTSAPAPAPGPLRGGGSPCVAENPGGYAGGQLQNLQGGNDGNVRNGRRRDAGYEEQRYVPGVRGNVGRDSGRSGEDGHGRGVDWNGGGGGGASDGNENGRAENRGTGQEMSGARGRERGGKVRMWCGGCYVM